MFPSGLVGRWSRQRAPSGRRSVEGEGYPCMLGPCHPSNGRQSQPGKIRYKGGRRPSRVTRSALVCDLARLHTRTPGGWPALAVRAPGADRCGAQPVRPGCRTGSAPTPPWPEGPKSGWRHPGARRPPEEAHSVTGGSRAASGSAPSPHSALPGAVASRVRRAPRALEDVEKVLTARAAQGCPAPLDVRHGGST